MASSDFPPRRFDVVVVPFPYSDQLAEKRRPALVISTDAFNRKQKLLWVLMITSAANPRRDGDIPIPTGKGGLDSPSLIRTAKIATIEPARVPHRGKDRWKDCETRAKRGVIDCWLIRKNFSRLWPTLNP
jgi:mRNA interferase MazF